MAIIVEDGTRVTSANSYISEAELTTYATARGITIAGNTEVLLIKAMDYIEYLEYKGIKLTDAQALQWPRADVIVDSYVIATNEIPQELKDGLAEVALSIDNSVDPLADLPRQKNKATVGPISVEYASSQATTIVRKITNKLRKLLAGGGGISFNVIRG